MTTLSDNDAKYINPEQNGTIVFFKVLTFMVFIILVFTGIANLLPQVEGQAPEDIKVDLGALTMDAYIAMGERLFKGKGTCTLCHNNLGRAPNMLEMNMEETAQQRLAVPEYKGEAKDSQSYFIESMVNPSKYVVPGYGKEGDPSPMPTINKAPIGLTDIEIGAIVAFLQAKDGGEPTVELPTDAPAVEEETGAVPEPPKVAASAEEALVKYTCTACHTVLDSAAPIGPELKTIGSRSSKEEIRSSIINPAAVIAEGFPPIMPPDFADKMMVKELELIVDFLAASKAAQAKPEQTAESLIDQEAEQASEQESEKKGEQ